MSRPFNWHIGSVQGAYGRCHILTNNDTGDTLTVGSDQDLLSLISTLRTYFDPLHHLDEGEQHTFTIAVPDRGQLQE